MPPLFWLQCYDTYNRQFQSSKFPPSPPITQWMAGAICGKQRKPYCSSVATRAPPIKSHPDRIGHLPSLCFSTTKKKLFIIWRIENTWGEIEKFCTLTTLIQTAFHLYNCAQIHICFYNSAQMILQLGNRIVTFYFLAATRRWMTFSILHCARHLPSSIFPHLRPIVHSPLHVP